MLRISATPELLVAYVIPAVQRNPRAALKLVSGVAALTVALAVGISSPSAAAAGPAELSVAGAVVDPDGRPVAGARVTVETVAARRLTSTGRDGRYRITVPAPGPARLTIEAAGFPPVEKDVAVADPRTELETVTLGRPTFADEVVVTASGVETRLADTAASMVVLSGEELWSAGATTIDGALRQVPGFALFRRTGSRTANPTAQGVTLRGVGASGSSRAVVLDDGVPLNDPFGGWVYWGRLPRAALGRAEVLRGGGSDLYGSAALGGVVQLFRGGREAGLELETSYGSQVTPDLSAALRLDRGPWSLRSSGEAFRTAGYVAVAPEARGPIDTAVASSHSSFDVAVVREPGPSSRAFVRGAYFEESRDNGTPFQTNDTRVRQMSAGWDHRSGADDLSARAWALREAFGQTFSAIAGDRASERPTRIQSVPSSSFGLNARWSRTAGGGRRWMLGAEAGRVKGETDERVLGSAGETLETAGGQQWKAAVFAGASTPIGARTRLDAGARFDAWRNEQGRLTAAGATTALDDRSENAVSPRLSLMVQATPRLSLAASAYRGFRAPTLNELYRSFRVGNVFTAANAQLEAERMSGYEAGALFGVSSRARLRASAFWMDLDRTVANVTVSVRPDLITRQRQNLGRARSRGVEVDAEARLGTAWAVSLGYLLADATVREFSADPALVGLRLPQIPRHSASAQLRYDSGVAAFGVQGRWSGGQFDDDQNRLALRSFFNLDAEARVPLGRRLEVFVGGENLAGARYDVGRTPVLTVGPPRSARAGVRVRLRTGAVGPEPDEHGMPQ